VWDVRTTTRKQKLVAPELVVRRWQVLIVQQTCAKDVAQILFAKNQDIDIS